MEFSWSALKAKMELDMMSHSWRTESYEFHNQSRKFRTFKEFKEAYSFVCDRAAQEAGQLVKRTRAV